MSPRVKRGAFTRKCRRCPWTGTYDTAAKADYAKRKHSCRRWQQRAEAAERGRARMEAVDRMPKPCLHPIAEHQHGTYACYTLDACRCEPCCAAQTAYEQNRVRQQAYGRWDNLVAAEPARRHVNRLRAQGMGAMRIAELAGVSGGSMTKLIYGHYAPGPGGRNGNGELLRGPSERIRKDVAQRILAVQLELRDGARVPNTDTARRLQALVANGWSMSKLGQQLGGSPGNFNPVVTGRRREVSVRTAKAVHALYLELADVAPPEDEWRDKIAASRSRGLARSKGWTPPLRLNGRQVVGTVLPLPELDDDTSGLTLVEDAPAYDEAAVERRMNGDRTAALTKADRIEIVRRARELGWSHRDIEHRTGLTKVERYLPSTAAAVTDPRPMRDRGASGRDAGTTGVASYAPAADASVADTDNRKEVLAS